MRRAQWEQLYLGNWKQTELLKLMQELWTENIEDGIKN